MSQIAPLGALVAHEGGWDEILLVGGPILVIIMVLAIAKRRVDGHTDSHPAEPAAADAEAPAVDDGA